MDIIQRLRCVLKGNPDAQRAADEIEKLRKLAVAIAGDDTEPVYRREYARSLLPPE